MPAPPPPRSRTRSSPAGVSPRSRGLGLETLPHASLRSGGSSEQRGRPASLPPRPALQPASRCAGGAGLQPRLRGSGPDRLQRPRSPRSPAAAAAASSAPEARGHGLEPRASTGVRCAPRGLGSPGGDGVFASVPLGKGGGDRSRIPSAGSGRQGSLPRGRGAPPWTSSSGLWPALERGSAGTPPLSPAIQRTGTESGVGRRTGWRVTSNMAFPGLHVNRNSSDHYKLCTFASNTPFA